MGAAQDASHAAALRHVEKAEAYSRAYEDLQTTAAAAALPDRTRSLQHKQAHVLNRLRAELDLPFVRRTFHAGQPLLAQRLDPAAAHRDFRWPVLDEFNWALDYFDVQARHNDAPALHIVGEDGSEGG